MHTALAYNANIRMRRICLLFFRSARLKVFHMNNSCRKQR